MSSTKVVMQAIKGPALFLAQFMSDTAPFNNLESIVRWAGRMGYEGVQIPTWDRRCFDLQLAAESRTYCDDIKGICNEAGVAITELSTHLQGQLIAVHPSVDELFDGFAPAELRGSPARRTQWAIEQLKMAARASHHLGLTAHGTFSGALLWHLMYPWPQRPAGLVEAGFAELAKRWLPILNEFDAVGVDVCYEIHPGEDLHDGASFERFLQLVNAHPRAHILYDPSHFVLQQLDYLDFIDRYHERIKMFHVKDAEFNPNGRTGVYGGYEDWIHRAGRFRSLGDGQIDFKSIFSSLTRYGFNGWAVVEWECCLKDKIDGAREGATFVADHIIRPSHTAFDDFSGVATDVARNQRLLGLR